MIRQSRGCTGVVADREGDGRSYNAILTLITYSYLIYTMYYSDQGHYYMCLFCLIHYSNLTALLTILCYKGLSSSAVRSDSRIMCASLSLSALR